MNGDHWSPIRRGKDQRNMQLMQHGMNDNIKGINAIPFELVWHEETNKNGRKE